MSDLARTERQEPPKERAPQTRTAIGTRPASQDRQQHQQHGWSHGDMTFRSDNILSRHDSTVAPARGRQEVSIRRTRSAPTRSTPLHDEPQQGRPEPHPDPRAEANVLLGAHLRGAFLGGTRSTLKWLLHILGWAGKVLIELIWLLLKVPQTALQLIATCVFGNSVVMSIVAGGMGTIVVGIGLYLAASRGMRVALSIPCHLGSAIPILGTWLDLWCAAITENDKRLPPKLASARFTIVDPAGCTPLVNAEVFIRLTIDATGLDLDYQKQQGGNEVYGAFQSARTTRQIAEAGRTLENINAAIDAAAKRATLMQRDLLGLLDQIILYPAGDETWYQRLFGGLLGAAGTGHAAMARRVDTALRVHAKAQAGSVSILAELRRPISMSLLCEGHNRQQRRKEDRDKEADVARLMRETQKKRGRPANEEQRALADIEREHIWRLERTVVAGTGEVTAKVYLVCDGVALIGTRARYLAVQIEAEQKKLVLVADKLHQLQQRVASWGLFASGRAICEEERDLVTLLEGSLVSIAEAYSSTKRW